MREIREYGVDPQEMFRHLYAAVQSRYYFLIKRLYELGVGTHSRNM